MKINRVAKPGKIMKQPPKDPNSGKMDSQIFIGKEDPQHPRKKQKKQKKASENDIVIESKLANDWKNIESLGLVDKQLVDIFMGFAEKTGGTYKGLYKGEVSNYTPQINLLNKAILLAMPISDTSTGSEIQASPKDIAKAAEYIKIALNGIDDVDEAFLTTSKQKDNMKITKKSMTDRDQLMQQVNASPKDFILKAIKDMGEEVVAGFSGVTLTDIDEIVNLCDDHELKEIIERVSNMKSKVQPELNVAAKKKDKKSKKKEWDPNPWAVCHTTVDKDKNPEKFERCVQDVKKKQAFNLNKYMKIAKWDKDTEVSPKEKGKWTNYTKEELIEKRDAAKKRQENRDKADPKDTELLRELNFAIRAKGDWGKAD